MITLIHGLLLGLALLCGRSAGVDFSQLHFEATCTAKCLYDFAKSATGEELALVTTRPDFAQQSCERQTNCNICLKVCNQPKPMASACQSRCQSLFAASLQSGNPMHDMCLDTCHFQQDYIMRVNKLQESGSTKFHCPLPESWPDSCQSQCNSDADCMGPSALAKCCTKCDACRNSTQLGAGVCIKGVASTQGVPPIPVKPQHKYKANGVELTWIDYYRQFTGPMLRELGPVVFLIEVRQYDDPGGELVNHTDYKTNQVMLNSVFTNWYNLYKTTTLLADMGSLTPGKWYQFRLQAFSRFGTGGQSEPTDLIRLRPGIDQVQSPRNLREVKSRISNGLIDSTLQWDPPVNTKVAWRNYELVWSQHYGSEGSFTNFRVALQNSESQYTIKSLVPSTQYKISVYAVFRLDGVDVKSQPVTLYITTTSIPPAVPDLQTFGGPPASPNARLDTRHRKCKCDVGHENAAQPRLIEPPLYEQDVLGAAFRIDAQNLIPLTWSGMMLTVEWQAEACIESPPPALPLGRAYQSSQEMQRHKLRLQKEQLARSKRGNGTCLASELKGFVMQPLLFQCHYRVTIRPFMGKESQKLFTGCFCTPSCHDVKSARMTGLCQAAESDTPGPPEALKCELIEAPVSRGVIFRGQPRPPPPPPPPADYQLDQAPERTYEAKLTWQSSSDLLRRHLTKGFRVTWGPRQYEPIDRAMYKHGIQPHLDSEQTQSKVVGPQTHRMLLRGLEAGKLYIVQVQTIGEKQMDSPVESIIFMTPGKSKDQTGRAGDSWAFGLSSSSTTRRPPGMAWLLTIVIANAFGFFLWLER